MNEIVTVVNNAICDRRFVPRSLKTIKQNLEALLLTQEEIR